MEREVDIYLIDDSISMGLLDDLEMLGDYQNSATVVVSIDHGVPSNTVALTQKHNRLRRLADKFGGELYDGEGIGQILLMEKHDLTDKTIVSASSYVCGCSSKGAHAMDVEPDSFLTSLQRGTITFETTPHVVVHLCGSRSEGMHVYDIALGLCRQYGNSYFIGKTIEMTDHNNILTNTEISTFFIALRELGATFRGKENGNFPSRGAPSPRELQHIEFNVLDTSPMIASEGISDYVLGHEGRKINQGFIGGCLGGGVEDLRVAAQILSQQNVDKWVDLIISPNSTDVYIKALEEGLVDIFLRSGAIIASPSCSACSSFTQGVIGNGDVFVTTGAKYCRGRMRREGTSLHASAATVASSCIAGAITNPIFSHHQN